MKNETTFVPRLLRGGVALLAIGCVAGSFVCWKCQQAPKEVTVANKSFWEEKFETIERGMSKLAVNEALGAADRISINSAKDKSIHAFAEEWDYLCPGTQFTDISWCIGVIWFDNKGQVTSRSIRLPDFLETSHLQK